MTQFLVIQLNHVILDYFAIQSQLYHVSSTFCIREFTISECAWWQILTGVLTVHDWLSGLINNFLNYTSVLDETKGPVQAPGGAKKGRSTDYFSLFIQYTATFSGYKGSPPDSVTAPQNLRATPGSCVRF